MNLFFWFAVFIASLVFLIKASDYFIESAQKIGLFFGIPSFIIGVTIVALGTSLPELASSISAVYKNKSEIVVANVIGSNITNVLLILGIIGLMYRKLRFDIKIKAANLIVFFLTSLLTGLFIYDNFIYRWEAGILLSILIFYLIYNISSFKSDEEEKEEKAIDWKPYLILLLSGLIVTLSASYNIDSIIQLAKILNINEQIIALGAVALGTSLPELFVSLSAVRKNDMEIAAGNILGSNIFNIAAVIGISGMIRGLETTSMMLWIFFPIMVFATIIYVVTIFTKRIPLWLTVVLIASYSIFIYQLFQQNLS